MNPERIEQLLVFLKEDPNDAFSKYALALEYQKVDPQKSLEYYDDLLSNHPDYIGTYYHAAALYAELDKRALAERTYEQGIEKARSLNETHALRELQTAYLNFQLDE